MKRSPRAANDWVQHAIAGAQAARAQAAERTVTQPPHRLLAWVLMLALLAYMSYLSFRAYLSPEFLIGFANLFAC